MTHLGQRVAALVDGELDQDARDRALAHLSRCPDCRRAVDDQRRLKSRVRDLSVSEPSAELLTSLFSMSRSVEAGSPAGRNPLPGTATAAAVRAPGADGRASERRRAAVLVVAGAGSVGAAVFGLAYALGGAPPEPAPSPVSPPVGQFSTEFAGSSSGSPFSDPAVGAYSVSWRTAVSSGGHR